MGFEEQLSGTTFEKELLNGLLKFIPEHIENILKDSTLDYQSYGEENEVLLKSILQYYSNLGTVLSDLDLTMVFLSKDRKLISEHYPELGEQANYYKYHFENYYIRLVTLGDIIGRLGNLIYGTGMESKKVSAYTFRDKSRKEGHEAISSLTDQLIGKLDELRQERHKKLHTGISDIKVFDGVVIFEDLHKALGTKTDAVLTAYTDQEISKAIEELRTETISIIELIRAFLEEASGRVIEIHNVS